MSWEKFFGWNSETDHSTLNTSLLSCVSIVKIAQAKLTLTKESIERTFSWKVHISFLPFRQSLICTIMQLNLYKIAFFDHIFSGFMQNWKVSQVWNLVKNLVKCMSAKKLKCDFKKGLVSIIICKLSQGNFTFPTWIQS